MTKKEHQAKKDTEQFLMQFRRARRACRKEAQNQLATKQVIFPKTAQLCITADDVGTWRAWEVIKLYICGSHAAAHNEPTLTLNNSIYLSDEVCAEAISQILTKKMFVNG